MASGDHAAKPVDLMAALRASLENAYRCNCGETFPSHLARVAHAATCPVMQAGSGDGRRGPRSDCACSLPDADPTVHAPRMPAGSDSASAYGAMGPGVWCSGDECLEWWPEGPMPLGWTVAVVEDRLESCCADCTAFYAAGLGADAVSDGASRALPSFVWVCETGEYEARYVEGVYTSPEAAEASLRATYGPPYRVTWEDARSVGGVSVTVTAHFEAVPGKSTRHTAYFDLTRTPLVSGDPDWTPLAPQPEPKVHGGLQQPN